MSKEDWIEIAFVFDDRPRPEELEKLFASLQTQSDSDTDGLNVAAWDETSDIHHYSGTPAEAAAACREYLDSTIGIRFDGFKLRIGSGYSDGILAEVPHITVREGVHPFTESDDLSDEAMASRRKRFVQTVARCAEISQPRWGFGRVGGVAVGEDESVEQLASQTLPPLYEYNFFRDETVQALERDRVATSPAWYIEEVDTGGVFLTVREPPNSCRPQTDECLAVADHLGIPIANPSRYR